MATPNRPFRPPTRRRFLPDIGLDAPAWLQNFLTDVKFYLEGLIQTPDNPGVPTNLTLSFSDPLINLTWTPSLNAVKYRVYQNISANFATAKVRGEVTAPRFIDTYDVTFFSLTDVTTVANSETSYYWVSALNSAGIESPPAFLFTTGIANVNKRASANVVRNADTLLTSSGLFVNVQAGRNYGFAFTGYTTSNVAGGVKFAMNGTCTAAALIYEGLIFDAGAVVLQTRGSAFAAAVGATTVSAAYISITGTIRVNAAGTLRVDFAQNANIASDSTLLTGSVLSAVQMV